MNAALEDLVTDLPELAPFIRRLDADADGGNPHGASLRGAIVWVQERAERDERSVEEKLAAIVKLCGPPYGFMHISSMEAFVGWAPPGTVRLMQ
jgi:hypothetical protein